MRTIWPLVVVLLAGCSGTPANFWRGVTRTVCKFNRVCAASTEDLGTCTAGMYDTSLDPEEFADGCTEYDAGIARECLAYLRDRKRDCIDFDPQPGACDGVCGPGTGIEFSVQRDASEGSPAVIAVPILAWPEPEA